jgi:sodium-dependent dicarboxylate transporter 2/3/5
MEASMAHHESAVLPNPGGSFWANRPGYKPVLLLIGFIVYAILVIIPPPQSMIELVSKENPSGYSLSSGVKTIAETVNRKLNPEAFKKKAKKDAKQAASEEVHEKHSKLLSERGAAQLAKVTLATFALVVFLWGTEALALGATDLMVAVLLYLFGILPIEDISKAYMQDAVIFIFGILAVAVGVAKTGLDKRIGLILLSRVKSAKTFAFVFFPMLAMSASFLSEHALVALLIPVLMGVYKVTCRMYGIEKDRALAIFLVEETRSWWATSWDMTGASASLNG